jgi:voltage-gated potassium channel
MAETTGYPADKQAVAHTPWRRQLHTVIFEADTAGGKLFDVLLILSILASVGVVLLDSVEPLSRQYGPLFTTLEWTFTILFTIEYALRLLCVGRPMRYARSFYGVVDLLAILPTYLSLVLVGTHYLLVIRLLRVLRIFRVLKLSPYLGAANLLSEALRSSRRKIVVFLLTVIILVTILGAVMYVIEGREHGFTSIPLSIYWAIVTMTTVGYGDLSPQTPLGQLLSSAVMILGYSIIAIPTGIVSVEIAQSLHGKPVSTQACPQCTREGHDSDAVYCKYCGEKL